MEKEVRMIKNKNKEKIPPYPFWKKLLWFILGFIIAMMIFS